MLSFSRVLKQSFGRCFCLVIVFVSCIWLLFALHAAVQQFICQKVVFKVISRGGRIKCNDGYACDWLIVNECVWLWCFRLPSRMCSCHGKISTALFWAWETHQSWCVNAVVCVVKNVLVCSLNTGLYCVSVFCRAFTCIESHTCAFLLRMKLKYRWCL